MHSRSFFIHISRYSPSLFLLLIFAISCGPDDEPHPTGTSGPVGPGTSHPALPPNDGGIPRDGGENHRSTFLCDGEAYTCEYADSFANCCEGIFYECPTDFPFYCPSDITCWFEEGLCVDTNLCTITGASCDATSQ